MTTALPPVLAATPPHRDRPATGAERLAWTRRPGYAGGGGSGVSTRFGSVALLGLALCCPLATWAAKIGVITMTEGVAQLIHGAQIYPASRGLALEKGDVLATSTMAFVQIELGNRTIIALGPDSALFIRDYPDQRAGRPVSPQYLLLHGWFKAESPSGAETAGERFWCRSIEIEKQSGAVVFQVARTAQRFFVESGSVAVTRAESPGGRRTVGPGEFAAVSGDEPLALASGVPSSFLEAMPRAFRDTLPPMAVRFQDAAVRARPLRYVAYDDVEELLTLPGRWRDGMVRRFGGRLQDPGFRRAVEAHLARHPEWDRALHPEKYRPAAGAAVPAGAAAAKPPRERRTP